MRHWRSCRRISYWTISAVDNPRYQVSTMGFPRETSWAKAISTGWDYVNVDTFAERALSGLEPQAVFLRRAYLLALFRFLPVLLLSAQSRSYPVLAKADVAAVISLIPSWNIQKLAENPGRVIVTILRLIDSNPELFDELNTSNSSFGN